MKANQPVSQTKKALKKRVKNHIDLYLMLIPIAVFLFVFWLIPLYGIQIGFRDYKPSMGFWGSKFVGFKHFIRYFESFYFWRTIKNTICINLYSLVIGFPLGIILSLMFNEIRRLKLRNFSQLISYAPNFLSAVVVAGMVVTFLSPSTGLVNAFIELFGGTRSDFLANPDNFWHIFVWMNIWQGIGFSTIMYTAAMSSISEDLYEAATLDGASKLKKIWHITLPGIQYVIIILLIMNLGNMMSLGFEKILLLQNELNLESSEVISTYVYKAGLIDGKYSYTTAIGLFNTVVNLIILTTANTVSKKVRGVGLW